MQFESSGVRRLTPGHSVVEIIDIDRVDDPKVVMVAVHAMPGKTEAERRTQAEILAKHIVERCDPAVIYGEPA